MGPAQMLSGDRPERGICEVLRGDRVVGLGFAIGQFHVATCAHVANSALGRADKRDPARPGEGQVFRLRFAIGITPDDDGYRTAGVSGWLPAGPGTFDIDDLAVLELADAVPAHVRVLLPVRYRPLMAVQMWGPQPGRPAGGHVKGELLGEVRGGRVQINAGSGLFRVRPGFSGGPVWESVSGGIAGVLSACGAEDDATDAYLLGMDRLAAAWPGWPQAGLVREPERGTGRDLLDDVADAARHHPDFAEADIRRASDGGSFLVATIEVRSLGRVLGTVRQAIGVHDGEVTGDVVSGFAATAGAYQQAGTGSVVGTLVYTCRPAPPALRDLAARSGVDLRSLSEFQTGVDLRPFAERQYQDLAADPRYPRQGYVPQRYTNPPSPEVAASALIESLLSWLAEPEGHLVLVLAPFGHGKTYLLHELACRMHDSPDYPAIPVLVRLRDLEKNHNIDDLLAAQLRRGGERRIDIDRLEYLRREGRIVLLFDGFDELARRVSYDQTAAHLAAIVQAAESRAKVVLTSRREYFLTDADAPAMLGRQLLTRAGRRVVHITDFDSGQIRLFLTTRLGDEAAGRFMAVLESTGLLELAANPRMLSLLTEIGESTLTELSGSGTAVTRASVFERVLDGWLSGEYERLYPHGTQPSQWVAALRAAVTSLAVELWSSGAASLALADLQAQADALMAVSGSERLDRDQAVHVLGSGSILVRVGDGRFDFVHRSLMEWLVADAIAAQLGQCGEPGILVRLTARPLTSLQVDLLAELATPDTICSWVQQAVKESDDQVRGNALAVAQRLGISIAEPPVLRGQDLRGQDFTGRDLAGADLTGADLTDAILDGTDLRRANLTGAMLVRARLDRADLSGAVLDHADLRDARLLGADLRSAAWLSLRSAQRAATAGAHADPSALTALTAAGATLPDQAAEPQSGGSLRGASWGASCRLSFDPGGDVLAIACGAFVQIWNVATGLPVRTLTGHADTVEALAWSPDGRHIATGGLDMVILIWDARTGQPERALTGHSRQIRSITWSPDSIHLASSSQDGTIRIWDTSVGVQERTRTSEYAEWVAWSPDGRTIAIASAIENQSVQIWEPDTGQVRDVITQAGYIASQPTWSPDGHSITTSDAERAVKIWDADSGEHLQTLSHEDWQLSVAWSPDGRHLLTASHKDKPRIWDTTTGLPVRTLDDAYRSTSAVAWSADGRYIAALERSHPRPTISIWDTRTWNRVQELADQYNDSVTAVTWSPDGRQIATCTDHGQCRIWDTTTGMLRWTFGNYDWHRNVHPVAWSPDGQHLACGIGTVTVEIFDPATGTEIRRLHGEHPYTTIGYQGVLTWSPDGLHVAHSGNQGVVCIFDVRTGNLTQTLDGGARYMAWSPDGRHIATTGLGTHLYMRDIRSGSYHVMTLSEENKSVRSVAWSPDGQFLATGHWNNGMVRIWGSRTSVLIRALPGPGDDTDFVTWSPDGRLIAAATEHIMLIWEAGTGHLIHSCPAASPVSAVAWSPDSQRLATGYGDNTVRIWNAAAGTLLATLVPLTDGWAVLHGSDRYAHSGTLHGEIWWTIGLTRFEPGELEPYQPQIRQVPISTPIAQQVHN